jgi:hypothetical protein
MNAWLIAIRALCALIAALALSPARAQVSVETQTDSGLWRVTMGLDKTTFIGGYGQYVEPAISREWDVLWQGALSDGHRGGGLPSVTSGAGSAVGGSGAALASVSSGGGAATKTTASRPDFWHIILPSGKLPRDLQLRYTGVLGGYASIMYEPTIMKMWAGLSPRLTIATVYDMNAVSGYAPSGFGILTDPTRGYASASFEGLGVELSLPVWGFANHTGAYALYAGHGWMEEWSVSYGAARSVFLQFSTTTHYHAVIQTYSLTAEWRPPPSSSSFLDVPRLAKFQGVEFLLTGYGTEHMWTIGATTSLIWRL